MKKNLSGGQLAGGNSTTQKAEHDFYATDPNTVNIFLDEFELDEDINSINSFLEPACGNGNICEVLLKRYEDKKVVGTDLVNRGYGSGNIDFLTNTFRNFDCVITNPPFSLSSDFILKALDVSNRYVIMLCKIQLLEGVHRKKILENTPLKYVYVHSSRQATWKNGKSLDENGKKWATTMCLAWFVWDKRMDESDYPIIKLL